MVERGRVQHQGRGITVILTLILLAIAALHLMWAIGWWFPIRDEAALARAVVGTAGITRMPGAVACALVVVALLAVIAILWWPQGWLRTTGLWGAAAVFLLRGAVAYTPLMDGAAPEEPFRSLNRRWYSPLILLIGAGLAGQAMMSGIN
jgi:hypothetical protein